MNCRYPRRLWLGMALALGSVAGLLQQATAREGPRNVPTEKAAMSARASNSTVVTGTGARLEAGFEYADSARALKVSYRLHNTGEVALMVFDRGNRHAVMTKKLVLGEIAPPLLAEDGGDVTLSHIAMPLPQPTPILPPTPLAVRVEPGAELQGVFEFALPSAQAPRRLRWCLGVTPFADDFRQYKLEPRAAEVWLASFDAADRQQRLCTPWYDVAKAAFDPA